MRSKKKRILDLMILGLVASLLLMPQAKSVTISGSRLVEDFSTDTYADYTASTGLWNIVDHEARAGVVVDAAGSGNARPVAFGDGSDGDLDISGSHLFDTDSHPNGFNYRRINITGVGTITASGRNALILRSLTTVDIAGSVTFTVDGGNGSPGITNGASTAPVGGKAVTCFADGGNGAAATNVTMDPNGGDGFFTDGTVDAGNGGASNDTTATTVTFATSGTQSLLASPNRLNFDGTDFLCGTGAAGGGANIAGGGGNYATGGGGGAGGGRVRIVAVGDINIGTISAKGGDSGVGSGDNGNICSGSGAAGNGGAVWLQSLHIVAPSCNADVNPGSSANPPNNCAASDPPQAGRLGDYRFDDGSGGTQSPGPTLNPAPSQGYIVQSKPYNLGTLNAGFPAQASVSATSGAGQAPLVEFAGSNNGSTFDAFTPDLTALSGRHYRYIKWCATIRTGAAIGASPKITSIALDYTDLGLDKLELKITPGCGSIIGTASNGDADSKVPLLPFVAGWLAFWFVSYRALRYGAVRNTRRDTLNMVPFRS